MDKARQYYRRFVDFWKDGDLDRERVEEAMHKSSLRTNKQGLSEPFLPATVR
jgi:hypothetical protein